MKNIHILPTDKPSRLYIWGNEKVLQATLYREPQSEIPNTGKNIYITNDEEIKDCWVLNTHINEVYFLKGFYGIQPITKKIILTTDENLIKDGVQEIDDEFLEWFVKNPSCEEVEVERDSREVRGHNGAVQIEYGYYEIIIPKEELINCPKCKTTDFKNCHSINCPMRKEELNLNCFDCNKSLQDCTCMEDTINMTQETLEEAAERFLKDGAREFKTAKQVLIAFAKEQQDKKMYSEKELLEFGELVLDTFHSEGRTKSGKDRLARIKFKGWFEQFKKK